MLHSSARLIALASIALIAAGCGHAPSTSVSTAAVSDDVERVVEYAPHMAVPSTTAVGVFVNGRWYAKGSEPTASATPAVAAPGAGHGNVHVTVSLKGVTDFTDTIRIRLHAVNGNYDVDSHDFHHADLVGTEVDTTFQNVLPGDYVVVRETLNAAGSLFDQDSTTALVNAGETEESDL